MQVNIHHAKTHLSRLLVLAAQGEEIIIAKSGKPMARLVPESGRRRAGLFTDAVRIKGKINRPWSASELKDIGID